MQASSARLDSRNPRATRQAMGLPKGFWVQLPSGGHPRVGAVSVVFGAQSRLLEDLDPPSSMAGHGGVFWGDLEQQTEVRNDSRRSESSSGWNENGYWRL